MGNDCGGGRGGICDNSMLLSVRVSSKVLIVLYRFNLVDLLLQWVQFRKHVIRSRTFLIPGQLEMQVYNAYDLRLL